MRKMFTVGAVCLVLTLVAVLLWRTAQEAPNGFQTEGSVKSSPVSSTSSLDSQQSAINNEAGNTGMVTGEKFNQSPIKPEALESMQAAIDAGEELNSSQIGTLSQLLLVKHPLDAKQAGQVRKNDLMNTLNRQANLPPKIIDLYATIYRDENQNEVLRDYAIQHVYEVYPKLADEKLKNDAIRLLHEATTEADTSTAGTAILALARLAERDASVSKQKVTVTAFDLVRNIGANPSARISALQVIGRLDVNSALPLLVETMQGESPTPVRLSAIGALGLYGGRNEVALLRSISEGDDALLKPAALVALRRIEARTGAF